MEIALIAAVADNYAIGRGNGLLWHLREDLRYFKKMTTGFPVVMGNMTFKSLGSKPLPGRLNIVITRYPFEAPEGVVVVGDLLRGYAAAEKSGAEKMFVIGGGETYRQAMTTVDTLYITHVHDVVEDADTFFPVIDSGIWREDSRSETYTDPNTGLTYEFTIYKRR